MHDAFRRLKDQRMAIHVQESFHLLCPTAEQTTPGHQQLPTASGRAEQLSRVESVEKHACARVVLHANNMNPRI